MNEIGKFLVVTGLLISVAGGFIILMDKIPFAWKVPGDIIIKRDNFTFAFPLGTCILLSIIMSIIISILRK
jgi:hypothetical protein